MKKIKLTQNKFTIVDDEDFAYLNQWKWYAKKHPNNKWTAERNKYIKVNGKYYGKTILMHREIMNSPCNKDIHHKNKNALDNRRFNLISLTRKEHEIVDGRINQRSFPGEKNGSSKLTEKDARMIIYMYRTGLFMQKEIANIYGIHQVTISKIITKKSWKHVWKGIL